ncbi:MAG: hypothetical protein H6Q56_151, partial [Deltaproteobacteria bacterium]|nr:hypothetical protein [Deltaproteobacteria bacterium]
RPRHALQQALKSAGDDVDLQGQGAWAQSGGGALRAKLLLQAAAESAIDN